MPDSDGGVRHLPDAGAAYVRLDLKWSERRVRVFRFLCGRWRSHVQCMHRVNLGFPASCARRTLLVPLGIFGFGSAGR